MSRPSALSEPRGTARPSIHYDPDRFGQFSESIARLFGTATFLVVQTILVAAWITLNVFAVRLRWDPYPFILLNLAFSTQAAYAAPLILLAQNRQADRDRIQSDRDRERSARTLEDTEYLARELAAIRLGLAELADDRGLQRTVERLSEQVGALLGDHQQDGQQRHQGDADADDRGDAGRR